MKLQRLLAGMPDRPPTAREILNMLIDTADARLLPGGAVEITFQPDAAILDALMCFDTAEREDEQIDYATTNDFFGDLRIRA
jgi:hypothetical protein